MSGTVEDFDGLCGIHAPFGREGLQLRCLYELGHHGDHSWEKYRKQFHIWGGSNGNPEWTKEQGFINSVISHQKVAMNKEEFLALVRQYSNETVFLSFVKYDHPAYIKLLAAGKDIVPWLLERLQDTIGYDYGDTMDHDNCPWLLFSLLGELTDSHCMDGFPREQAGKLDKVRSFILEWGTNQKLIK